MALYHAVVLLDHKHAQIVEFDGDQTRARKLHANEHETRQHGSAVRSEHEFFGQVCDALEGIKEVLVTGPRTAQDDFRHYVNKHRPQQAAQIAGWETVDHPTEGQLVALARQFFVRHDRMNGTPTPT